MHDLPGRGRFRLIDPAAGRVLAEGSNLWTYFWGCAAARLFAAADPTMAATHMLVEYANLATPTSTIAPPTPNRQDGLAYYQGLAGDPQRDYIRVPLLGTPTLDVDPDSPGAGYLSAGQANRLTATALTAGTSGANGKSFSNSANSVVTGCALVAAPAPSDPTRDLVLFRGYYSTGQQVVLPPSGVVVVEYAVSFE